MWPSCVRFRSRRLVVSVALLCLLAAACLVLLVPGDPWCDVVISYVFGHDTRYAPGYSEGRWNGLRRGMTTTDVETMMGPPLRKLQYDGDCRVWWYSESPRHSDYWMRAVSFRGGAAERFIEAERGPGADLSGRPSFGPVLWDSVSIQYAGEIRCLENLPPLRYRKRTSRWDTAGRTAGAVRLSEASAVPHRRPRVAPERRVRPVNPR